MRAHHFLVGDIVGNFAKPIHVIRKADEAGGKARHGFKRMAHHAGAGHFAESANMGQAGGAVTCFKQNIFRRFAATLDALHQFSGFFKGPSLAVEGGGAE